MSGPGLVEVFRGETVESAHRVHVVVADGGGNVVRAAGEAERVTFLRSALKPFQALPLVTSDAAERFGLTDAELAVACGSHSGEPEHAEAVASMLKKAGLEVGALRCGVHEARAPRSVGGPLAHNCSGNHAGMLLLQIHLGGDAARYLDPASPAQRAIREAVDEVSGASGHAWAIDGCGAPAVAVPLRLAARMYGRLALPQGVPRATEEALLRIQRAMTRHPELVGGTGSFDTDLMGASEDRLVSKAGAEGVQCVGDLSTGMGLALKVEDGAKRAAPAMTVEALRQLAWLEGRAFEVLGEWWRPVVQDTGGRRVGEVRPVLDLA